MNCDSVEVFIVISHLMFNVLICLVIWSQTNKQTKEEFKQKTNKINVHESTIFIVRTHEFNVKFIYSIVLGRNEFALEERDLGPC